MKKCILRLVALVIVASFLVVLPITPVSAASYPTIFQDVVECCRTIPEGETGTLSFTIFPKYKNERYTITLYDESGTAVGRVSSTYYNSGIGMRTLTSDVDTKALDLSVGTYTVEYYLSFYSIMEWHDAPNKFEFTIEVVENKCQGQHDIVKTTVYDESTCEDEGWAKFECTKCDYLYTAYLDLSDHSYAEDSAVACDVCGTKRSETTLLGDVDGNSTIDSTDARLVLQYAVGKVSFSAFAANGISMSDVNADNKIDSTDARLILQYAVGKIQAFPNAG